MALLSALGLTATGAMSAAVEPEVEANAAKVAEAANGGAAARGSGAQSAEMKALVARFQEVMGRIKALPPALATTAAALKKAAIAAGNLSTSAKGIVLANAALATVEAQLLNATPPAPVRTPTQPPEATLGPDQGSQPQAPSQPDPQAPATAKPEFKGYPSTLRNAEKLIGQIKKYGFTEGIHATSMDASDRGDVAEIWCSGLSNWALADAGYDLDAPIPGKTCFEKKKRKNKKTGEEEWVTVEKPVTIRSLVEGFAVNFADTREEAESEASYAQAGLFGATPADDDPRVKGAAGAFVLAGIGKEILDLEDVKPGDFAQTRQVGAPKGHAFQIHACLCEGECLVGPGNAPTLVKDLGGEVIATAAGEWHAKASFRIDGATSPLFVGAHRVVKSDWLESNVASSMEDKTDTDGGVQIRHGAKFEDPAKGGKRTYVGRLTSSSWTGYSRAAPPLQKPEPETAPVAGG